MSSDHPARAPVPTVQRRCSVGQARFSVRTDGLDTATSEDQLDCESACAGFLTPFSRLPAVRAAVVCILALCVSVTRNDAHLQRTRDVLTQHGVFDAEGHVREWPAHALCRAGCQPAMLRSGCAGHAHAWCACGVLGAGAAKLVVLDELVGRQVGGRPAQRSHYFAHRVRTHRVQPHVAVLLDCALFEPAGFTPAAVPVAHYWYACAGLAWECNSRPATSYGARRFPAPMPEFERWLWRWTAAGDAPRAVQPQFR